MAIVLPAVKVLSENAGELKHVNNINILHFISLSLLIKKDIHIQIKICSHLSIYKSKNGSNKSIYNRSFNRPTPLLRGLKKLEERFD